VKSTFYKLILGRLGFRGSLGRILSGTNARSDERQDYWIASGLATLATPVDSSTVWNTYAPYWQLQHVQLFKFSIREAQ